MVEFTHLHVHSHYSILDGAASLQSLVDKAVRLGMTALALTDHGSMYGIKEFHALCAKKGLKPLLGCETYVARRSLKQKHEKIDQSGNHLILIAKNRVGYHNLVKMITIANTEGKYYRPRVDKELLSRYHEGIICSSACMAGEVPQLILENKYDEAGETIEWFKSIFGDDYYLEVMYHPSDDPFKKADTSDQQEKINNKIYELAALHGVKVIATNDVHFTDKEDAETHDVLVCLNTGCKKDSPDRKMRYTGSEWFKSQDEMFELFGDHPDVLANTMEVAAKVEFYELDKPPKMPKFPIPEEFGDYALWREKFDEAALIEEFTQARYEAMGGYEHVLRIKYESDYLAKLVYDGAIERYGKNMSDEAKQRIDMELTTIKTMGFPGYFLIVQDFIAAGRKMGVLIGKGRGSAAGSVVAYCTKITDVDPLKYNLLFERFLNPGRISMPDIDVDFDNNGRNLVINYVRDKYGADKVAHICNFGTMQARSALADVCRVMNIDLSKSKKLSNSIPKDAIIKGCYEEILGDLNNSGGDFDKVIEQYNKLLHNPPEELDNVESKKWTEHKTTLKVLAEEIKQSRKSGDPTMERSIEIACSLEGAVRNSGVHACGMLIGRDSLDNDIPLAYNKEGDNVPVTQYEGTFVEPIGLLKMDFLSLKYLSVIKECLKIIKMNSGKDFDINSIPLDDPKTLNLYRMGATTYTFQFESDKMRAYLRALKPSSIDDIIAMNALYRPGPMDYIPDFIRRKNGLAKIEYDHPIMEQYLKPTYGVTVFQEQVMLLSRALAGFSLSESDTLRKAMGKKNASTFEQLHLKFIDGCKNNPKFVEGCEQMGKSVDELIDKIWKDWEAFARYAFNKSHAVCYAIMSFHTAYLKVHYSREYLAACLTCNFSNIEEITILMEECKRLKIKVLGPSVNESYANFMVNGQRNLRYGLKGIKTVGEKAVEHIVDERTQHGVYKDIFDFVSRVDLRIVNKKCLQALVYAGAFDCFDDIKRSQYFQPMPQNEMSTFLDELVKFGNNMHQSANRPASLFGDDAGFDIERPKVPQLADFNQQEMLEREKEHIGLYLCGHPLDPFKEIIKHHLKVTPLNIMNDEEKVSKMTNIHFVGLITEVHESMTKKNKPYAKVTMLDYSGTYTMTLFGRDYTNYKNLLERNYCIYVQAGFRQQRNDESQMFFTVSKIQLLSEVQESIKKVTLFLSANLIDKNFTQTLQKLTSHKSAKVTVFLVIKNPTDNSTLKLLSRSHRAELSPEFIDFVENSGYIEDYKLEA